MKFLRNNFAYILLALIAVVLIFVTISLQVAILSTGETPNSRSIFYTLRQQLAELIQPATDTPGTTLATVGQPTATVAVVPTNTPNVIIVQPSPLPATPTTAPTTAPVLPTATMVAATNPTMTTVQVPGISNAGALATRLAAPTATPPVATTAVPSAPTATLNLPPQNPPTDTPQNIPQNIPQNTPPVAADFRIGYVEGDPECDAITGLMQLVLEREFNLRITTVLFSDPAALFTQLASKRADERVDVSFCYRDPRDRSYLQQYFGFMIFIGSGYRQVGDQKYIIMSNAAVKSPIERGNPCLYRFLTNLNLTDVDLRSGDVAAWYQSHAEQVASWTRCE